MGYYLKAATGVALFLAAVAAFCWAFYSLVHGVTQVTGADMETEIDSIHLGRSITVLIVALFVGLGGIALAGLRGDPPSGGTGRPSWLEALGLGLTSFGIFFLAVGAVSVLAMVAGPAGPAGSRWGLIAMGAVFIVMGLVPLWLAVRWARSDRREASEGGDESQPLPLSAAVVSLADTANALTSRPRFAAGGGAAVSPAPPYAPGSQPSPGQGYMDTSVSRTSHDVAAADSADEPEAEPPDLLGGENGIPDAPPAPDAPAPPG